MININENIETYIQVVFAITVLTTLGFFYKSVKESKNIKVKNKSNITLIVLIIWIIIQSTLTIKDVYNTNLDSIPPNIFRFGIFPTIALLIYLFSTSKGKEFIDNLDLKYITYLNIVRVPVEIVLFWLFLNKEVPQLMTFEGRNFDIISGLTAPLIGYFGFTKNKLSNRIILIWNFICLGLLVNIILNAILSSPSKLQQFGFEQPNTAILNFPISLLPTFIVPLVLFGHFVSIRQITMIKD